MATRNFHGNRAGGDGHAAERPAMVHDNPMEDTVDAATGVDKISGLPDDVLLDILGRLVMAGDAHAVARTSALSRRWRSLPWPHIPSVFLDAGKFIRSDDGEWQRVRRRRRQRFLEHQQHEATAGLTDALARFLAAPPTERVIQTLSLKLILTRRDYLRRIGDLVGASAADDDAGTAAVIKNVEVEIVTEMGSVIALAPDVEEPSKLGDGERLGQFRQDCPGAFRCLTMLTLHDLWFHDPAELNDLVRGCNALELLSLSSCALTLPAMDDDDGGGGGGEPPRRPALTIDAPESRLQRLLCDLCLISGVELVQAPEIVELRYRAVVLGDSPPISFGCTPSLKGLCLGHYQGEEMTSVKLKLSELLVNGGGQLVSLSLMFENSKIWLQPENPKQLRAALRGLKYLNLVNISPECNLSWAMFLLEAAPFLETLDIHISSHICLDSWHKKGDEDANLTWEPSTDFRHHHLKQHSVKRAFHVDKDLLFARLVMGFAVNLQAVTLGVESIGCPGCMGALPKYQDLARSRLRFNDGSEYVDAFVKELMDGITTSAKITLLLSDGVCPTTAHSA